MSGINFLSIQYLRGVAATMVVLFHLGSPLERLGYRGVWPVGLSAGVDIFFVISGFVMWISTIGRTVTPWQFFRKRIVRIVPLYWLLTTVMLVVMLVLPSALQTSRFSLPHVIASYLFLPMQNPGKGTMEPLLFPGWTLNYEMFFYLIFGTLLLVSPRLRLLGTALLFGLLVLVGWLAGWPTVSVAGFYTSPRLLEFVAGMVLAWLVCQRGADRLLAPPVALAGLAAGFAALLFNPFPSDWPWALSAGLPSALIVACAVSLEGRGRLREWRPAHLLGDASYSIYLTQLISMAAFRFLWSHVMPADLPGQLLLYPLLDLSVAIGVGIACYFLAERPLTAWLTRDRRARLATAAV